MADMLPLLRSMGEALDGLSVALCVFDDADATLFWNRTFLDFFPEHEPHIRVGEHYSANLRRFYEGRLPDVEKHAIERYIAEGVARHRAQHRPYSFEHRGLRLLVSSLPLPGIGRIRVWRAQPVAGVADAEPQPWTESSSLLDRLPDGVMVCADDHRILGVNQPFVLMYGLKDRTDAIGASFEDVYRTAWGATPVDAAEQALFDAGLATLAENLRFAGAPFEVPLPGQRWSRVIAQPNQDGTSSHAHVDITELKRQQMRLATAEQRARQSEALLQQKSALLEATLERLEQGVMMVSAERVVEVCNRRAIELLGLPAPLMATKPRFEEVLAFQWQTDEFVHTPEHLKEFVRRGGILDQPHSYDRMRPDGRVIEINSIPMEGGGILRTYSDITDRRRNEERIRHVARHDGLTSLANRGVFLECLEAVSEEAARTGKGFAVHYLDLDGFKPVNDRFGHAVGDQLLALIAERMRKVARDTDVVARMGGDEFAILQRGVAHREGILGLAQRMLDAIGLPARIESHEVRVGASLGVAVWPDGGQDPEALMRHADQAMYAAKSAGRNCIRVFGDPPMV